MAPTGTQVWSVRALYRVDVQFLSSSCKTNFVSCCLLFLMTLVVAMCCRPWPWRVVQHHPDSQRAWQSWGTVFSCSLVFSSLVLHFKIFKLATFSDNLLHESILKPHTCARTHTHTRRSADEVPTWQHSRHDFKHLCRHTGRGIATAKSMSVAIILLRPRVTWTRTVGDLTIKHVLIIITENLAVCQVQVQGKISCAILLVILCTHANYYCSVHCVFVVYYAIDWCCFYYFLRNSLVALLEALAVFSNVSQSLALCFQR